MRRWLFGGALLVTLLLGWQVGPWVLRRLDLFKVRRVEVVGATYLGAADVVRALALGPRANLFDPMGTWHDRLLAMPGVRRVTLGRRIPGALIVEIEEFEPVALAMTQGRLAPVDRRGRVLPFDPTRAPTDLPIAPADPGVTALIETVRDADPELFRSVVRVRRDRDAIILETVAERLLLRAGAVSKDIDALATVRSEARRRGIRAGELDARFEGRILVRGGRS